MNVIIVDDRAPFRESLKFFFETQKDIKLVGSGADGFDAIRLTEELMPDVVVLAIDLPLLDGLKVTASIRQRCPSSAVMIVADEMKDETIVQAVRLGVRGFLLRGNMLEEALPAVRILGQGSYFMSREISLKTLLMFSAFVSGKQNKGAAPASSARKRHDDVCEPAPGRLNKMELQIITFIGQGLTNREISETLGLREGTIRNYISIILHKIHLENRTQIALYAINNDFVTEIEAPPQKTGRAYEFMN
jgi:DNA-binding NarL/FixJ family response regulator